MYGHSSEHETIGAC